MKTKWLVVVVLLGMFQINGTANAQDNHKKAHKKEKAPANSSVVKVTSRKSPPVAGARAPLPPPPPPPPLPPHP